MANFRKWSLRLLLGLLAIPVLFALYLAAAETIIYVRGSPERAEQAAHRAFLRVCADEHFDPRAFSGPTRPRLLLDEKLNEYLFVWSKTPEKAIYVQVSYLPYDVVDSMSAPLVEEKDRSISGGKTARARIPR